MPFKNFSLTDTRVDAEWLRGKTTKYLLELVSKPNFQWPPYPINPNTCIDLVNISVYSKYN